LLKSILTEGFGSVKMKCQESNADEVKIEARSTFVKFVSLYFTGRGTDFEHTRLL